MDYQLLAAFIGGVGFLLLLILYFRVSAFVSLLISSIAVGFFSGMEPLSIVDTMIEGMGSTLGFVATVVGLGSMIGAILEVTGATENLAQYMLRKMGTDRSRIALSISGFLIAIPVFFDVAFIILVPIVYALQEKTGKSILYYGIALLSSLAVTHAFIPPTPGPIAVADILQADLGWIILFGFIVGIPTTIVSGLVFGKYISQKIYAGVPEGIQLEKIDRVVDKYPPVGLVLLFILLPIILILGNTLSQAIVGEESTLLIDIVQFIGHPIVALIITLVLALYFIGVRYGATKEQLHEVANRSLGPAGIIILITGAGGVFKQMLIESGAGVMLGEQVAAMNLSPLLLGFIIAIIVRVIQGSATVAMITAAGIVSPLILGMELSPQRLALLVLAIAAGSSGFSHVNDSGFWLVNKYLGISEVQTLRSWTVMMSILAVTAIILIMIISLFIG